MNVPIEPRPNPPSWTPPPRPTTDTRGSLWLGFGLAWLVAIVGNVVALVIVGASSGGASALTVLALPWLAEIGLIVWLAAKGKPRTASGVAIGLGTIIAIAVLLIAACFSLLANNFR